MVFLCPLPAALPACFLARSWLSSTCDLCWRANCVLFLHWWGFSILRVMWLSRYDYIINDAFFPLGVQADTLNPVMCLQGGSSQSVPVLIILSRESIAKPTLTELSCSYISVTLSESHKIQSSLTRQKEYWQYHASPITKHLTGSCLNSIDKISEPAALKPVLFYRSR